MAAAVTDDARFRAGARVELGYSLAGKHRRVAGTVAGHDASGRVCVAFDDGATGCFSVGALLNPIPPREDVAPPARRSAPPDPG